MISVITRFRIDALVLFLTAAILLALPANEASAINVSLSTGNLHYADGQGNSMPYRLYLPPGYNTPGAKFPLIMFLHGAGESGTDNSLPSTNGHIDNLYNAAHGSYGAQYKAFLLVPQTTSNWGWEDYYYPQSPQYGIGQRLAMGIINLIDSTYQVDANRQYVTGLSMGGGGTFDIAGNYPNIFAAASPLSGWGNVADAPILKNMPIWAFHGVADTTVDVSYTDEMVNAIKAAGGTQIEYTRVPGVGHGGWETFYNGTTYKDSKNETFYQWMFSKSLAVPEPSTAALGLGAVGFGLFCWMRKRRLRCGTGENG
jgi:predicted peptidase